MKISVAFIVACLFFANNTSAQAVAAGSNVPAATTTYTTLSAWPNLVDYSNTATRNFTRVYTPMQPLTNEADISIPVLDVNNPNKMPVKTSYIDGLGRPLQDVARWGVTGSFNDLVKVYVYDNAGRESYEYLPYNKFGNIGKLQTTPLSTLAAFYNLRYLGEHPYSQTIFDNSPLERVTESRLPGHNWVGSARGTEYVYSTQSDYVAKWTVDFVNNAPPVFNGFFSAGDLYVTRVKDADGKASYEYKDKEGRVILKRQLVNGAVSSAYVPENYLQTYYVYDDLDNLRWVITPAAVGQSLTTSWQSTWNISTAILDGLCYRYWYDAAGRLIEKRIPGKEAEYFVYDRSDRPVLYQDGNLRTANKWSFTIYDAWSRVLATGVYSSQSTQSAIVNTINNTTTYPATDLFYYLKNDLFHPSISSISDCEIYTQNKYDEYPAGASFDNSYNTKLTGVAPFASLPVLSNHTTGLVTSSDVKVLDPNNPVQWLSAKNFYDDKGRLIQLQRNNHKGGNDIVTNQYDFSGDVVSSVQITSNPSAVSADPNAPAIHQLTEIVQKVVKNYTTNTVVNVQQNINNSGFRDIYSLQFGPLNNISNKNHLGFGNHFTYNINGWLTGINPEYADGTTTPTSTAGPFFGERLSFDQGFESKYYNGNIAGITWRNSGTGSQRRSYGYTYDKANRMTQAEFRQLETSGWSKQFSDFTVSNIDYDANGNLKTMKQKGPGVNGPVTMDNLTYDYYSNSNQLSTVTDAATGQAPDVPDFSNGTNSGVDYTYDANGNLKSDANKTITNISYNYQNQPEVVGTSYGSIQFVYDGTGTRLKKVVTPNTGTPTVSDFIGNFEFKDNHLQYIYHPEGRYRPFNLANSAGTASFFIDYFIKDHLGNVRTIVNAAPLGIGPTIENPPHEYEATLEVSVANSEMFIWSHLDDVRENRPLSSDPNDTKAALMNGADSLKRIGPAIMLRVMPGDKFSIAAQTYFGEFPIDEVVNSEQMVTALLGALLGGNTYAGTPVAELPDNLRTIESTVGNFDFTAAYDEFVNNNTNPLLPKAHLSYILFDENNTMVEDNSGAMQFEGPAGQWNTLSTNGEIEVQKAGYLLVFASNKTQAPVYVDAIDLTFYSGSILEEDHYYPFGLTYTQPAAGQTDLNQIKYNSKRLERNEFGGGHGLDWYDYGARMMDMQIGRWNCIDVLSESYYNYTPYSYAANNPIILIDIDGRKITMANYIRIAGTDRKIEAPNAYFESYFERTRQTLNKYDVGCWFNQLEQSNAEYKIIQTDGGSFYDPVTKSIYWNPNLGVLTTEGKTFSPATVLNHEGAHAAGDDENPEQYGERKLHLDPRYGNNEEKSVITTVEQITARALGEIDPGEVTRHDHNGRFFSVADPMSNDQVVGSGKVSVVKQLDNQTQVVSSIEDNKITITNIVTISAE